MPSTLNADLEIPLWSKPAPARRNRKMDSEIPLYVKPLFPNNIEKYVSVVPSRQIKVTQHFASLREVSMWSCIESNDRVVDADIVVENASCMKRQERCSAERTDADDSSDESTIIGESTPTEDTSDESSVVDSMATTADCVASSPVCVPGSNTKEALVAGLREARLQLCARRLALGNITATPEVSGIAACSQTADPVADLRAARLEAAARREAPTAAKRIESVWIRSMNGTRVEISRLYSAMQICEFCEMVAAKLDIPDFAVRLLFEDQVLHMSCHGMSLSMAGITEGSELTLVKEFGWAKPDVRQLVELERQLRGQSQLYS